MIRYLRTQWINQYHVLVNQYHVRAQAGEIRQPEGVRGGGLGPGVQSWDEVTSSR